jgi:TPR repeat protein
MSVTERTKYHRSLDALAFDESRRGPQHAPSTSRPSTDFSVDDSTPLFLPDLQDQPDQRAFAPLVLSQRTNILTRVVAGGLAVSAFANLVAVFNSDVTRVVIDKFESVYASASRLGIPSREDAAAPSKTLDAETLAALTTRAKSLLALGNIAAARLLLERAANALDASAAFLLAQTYDPAVLGVRVARSITPDPVMARDWYRNAASFDSAEAQQRLTKLHN